MIAFTLLSTLLKRKAIIMVCIAASMMHPGLNSYLCFRTRLKVPGRKLIKVDPRNTTQRCSSCTMLPGTYSPQGWNSHSAHRTKTATSHIRDASFGDDAGSCALRRAAVHFSNLLNRAIGICVFRFFHHLMPDIKNLSPQWPFFK